MRKFAIVFLFYVLVTIALPGLVLAAPAPKKDLSKIQHIIVIYLENRSFDNLFGQFPGADGITPGLTTASQTDMDGKPYAALPDIADARFPADLSNRPFAIDQYAPIDTKTGDLTHRFYNEQKQINGGRMDRFAALSGNGGLAMGYYDASHLGLWQYAEQYTLADHFFHAAFGGSFLNHFWLVCACTPRYENAPAKLVKDDVVTEDGFAINTMYSQYRPHPAGTLLPPQEMPTIGDRLSAKGISWAWYSGGWDDAMAGKPDKSFQFHHQPFAYFKAYGDDTPAKAEHLKDEKDFLADLEKGTLPAVAFYKPLGEMTMHPGYADITSGDKHITLLLQAIEKSPVWGSSVVIVTFDENGGFWDHVPPPAGDRWGPGTRVPAIIISPFARRHYVDHTVYDTTSILKLIETRFDISPLGSRDAKSADLTGALELSN